MVARSRTLPIGQRGPASGHGVIRSAVDLNAQFNFDDSVNEHSAQWTAPFRLACSITNKLCFKSNPPHEKTNLDRLPNSFGRLCGASVRTAQRQGHRPSVKTKHLPMSQVRRCNRKPLKPAKASRRQALG